MLENKGNDTKLVIMLLAVGGIIYFFFQIGRVLLPFGAGILLAYLLYPILEYLKKKNISRTWSIYILTILFLVFIIIISFFIIPSFLNELEGLSSTMPEYINRIGKYIDYLNGEYHRVKMPPTVKEAIDRILNRVEEQLINFMESLTEQIISSLRSIISLLIAPFISYYILKDMVKIKRGFIKVIPKNKRSLFYNIAIEINKIFLGYLRGQVWLSIIVGILSTIGLLIFQIRFSIILGFFACLSNMIPFIGPIIGSVPSILIALLTSSGKAISIAILFIVIQQVESSLISPRIMSGEVGLHPLAVIFSFLLGTEFFGLWGMLLAVPIAACIKVLAKIFFRKVQENY